MLKQRRQSQKTRIGKSIVRKLRDDEYGEWGTDCLMDGVYFGSDENALKLNVLMLAQLCERTNIPLDCTI